MMKLDYESITENLGRTIRQIREAKSPKPSLMELAKQVGVSYQHLSDIEREVEQNYKMKTVERIAQVLGLDFIELLTLAVQKKEPVPAEKLVPIVGYANSADPRQSLLYSDNGLPTAEPIDKLVVSGALTDPNAYGLIVKDNSMGFVGRDWMLIVSPAATVGHLDPVIVIHDGKVLFRQVEITPESYKFFTVIDPNNALIVPKSDKVIIHKVWQFQSPW